jgi:D-glycero-D-manno-heptose 1,7-bisphosphate phosphatase
VLTRAELDAVHRALTAMLAAEGAIVDLVLCCTTEAKCPWRKPAGGMLVEALARLGAAETPFVGDQMDDLRAAFHTGCRRVLVKTGLGRKTLADGLPPYLSPVSVQDDLAAAVDAALAGRL